MKKIVVVPIEKVYEELEKGTSITVCYAGQNGTIMKQKIVPKSMGTNSYRYEVTIAKWLELKLKEGGADILCMKVE